MIASKNTNRVHAQEQVARFSPLANPEQAERNFVQQFKEKEISSAIPGVRIKSGKSIWIFKLTEDAELVASNGATQRLIKPGGVKLNGKKINNADMRWMRLEQIFSEQESGVYPAYFPPKNS